MSRTRRPSSGFAALRLCFDAKSGVKLSLCIVFTATLHTFQWAQHAPFTHSRAPAHNRHNQYWSRVVFNSFVTSVSENLKSRPECDSKNEILTKSHMWLTCWGHDLCPTADVGRFFSKWQSVNPGSFNSAVSPPLPGSQRLSYSGHCRNELSGVLRSWL